MGQTLAAVIGVRYHCRRFLRSLHMEREWLCMLLGFVCSLCATHGQVVQIIPDDGGSSEWVRQPHQPKNEKKVDEPRLECLYEYTAVDTVLCRTKLAQVILQVGSSWTKFIDYYNYWIDSVCWRSDWKITTAEILELDQPMPREFYESQLRHIATGRFTCLGQVGLDFYVYEDSTARMDWTLAEGEATVCGYACRKATTRFRGRDWTVWYRPAGPHPAGGDAGQPAAVRGRAAESAEGRYVLHSLYLSRTYGPAPDAGRSAQDGARPGDRLTRVHGLEGG